MQQESQRSGKRIQLATLGTVVFLTACSTPPQSPPPSQTQLEFALASGTYRCEQNVRLKVQREFRNGANSSARITWDGREYLLLRDPSYSGLPRFEDSANALVWIDLPWKSLLLDSKTNKPLINECRPH